MKKILKYLLSVLCLLCSITVSAYDFNSGKLYYNITSESTVALTYHERYDSDTKKWVRVPYTGDVIIPSSVTYNAITYSVTSIGSNAFLGCSSLRSVPIHNSVTLIGDYAFGGCNSLERVDITDLSQWCRINFGRYSANPLEYTEYLYVNGNKTADLNIPDDVTEIKDYTFQGYRNLTSVTIPKSVSAIGYKVFNGCSSLATVDFNAINCKLMGGNLDPVFQGCVKLTSVNIGNDVTVIPNSAFCSCSGITSVTIPNSVTAIGWSAFRYCSGLTSVTLGNSALTIDDYAFYGCSGLKDLRNYNENPQTITTTQFGGVEKSNCTLYVPKNSLELYKKAAIWKDFANIVGVNISGVNATNADAVKITANGSEITIEGADNAAQVMVYDINGQLVYSGIEKAITAPQHGIYIVKVADVTQKVIL